MTAQEQADDMLKKADALLSNPSRNDIAVALLDCYLAGMEEARQVMKHSFEKLEYKLGAAHVQPTNPNQ